MSAADPRYLAFVEVVADLRPRLHRYCARMVGSALDGEDMVQEALFHAYRRLETFDESRPMAPWLLRIAHNRCVDFLRQRERETPPTSATRSAASARGTWRRRRPTASASWRG